jgi:putative copper export protein
MPVFEILVATAALGVVAFQAWLTRRVFQSQLYERKQKIWQAQLIWLLPILGAGLVFSILQEDRKAEGDAARLNAPSAKSPDKRA